MAGTTRPIKRRCALIREAEPAKGDLEVIMNKVLKDPIAPNVKQDGVYPWSYNAPSYDNRTSDSIPGGNYYGVGFRTPVGKSNARSLKEGPIVQESRCFSPSEVFYGGEDQKG